MLSPQQKFDMEVYALLQEIERQRLYSLSPSWVEFEVKEQDNLPSPFEQAKLLGLMSQDEPQNSHGLLLRNTIDIAGDPTGQYGGLITEAGIYSLKILDGYAALLGEYNQSVSSHSIDTQVGEEVRVFLSKSNQTLFLNYQDKRLTLAHYQDGSKPDELTNYLFRDSFDANVSLATIQTSAYGLSGLKDIKDVLRKAGFSKPISDLFAPELTARRIKLVKERTLSTSQLARLIHSITEKSGKERNIDVI